METKKQIRQRILKDREQMSKEICQQKSEAIMKSVMMSESFIKAEELLVYVSYQREVVTESVIEQAWQMGKRVYVPKILLDTMQFFKIDDWAELTEEYKGIREPKANATSLWQQKENKNVLVLMPGVVFDENRYRVGYGKGFYDRFLEQHPLPTIAVCFDCQLVDEVPHEGYDKRVDILYTETRTITA